MSLPLDCTNCILFVNTCLNVESFTTSKKQKKEYRCDLRYGDLVDKGRMENSLKLNFEPRSYFVSRLSMIVRVNVVLNRSVIDND